MLTIDDSIRHWGELFAVCLDTLFGVLGCLGAIMIAFWVRCTAYHPESGWIHISIMGRKDDKYKDLRCKPVPCVSSMA
jgi:hypothetical protein